MSPLQKLIQEKKLSNDYELIGRGSAWQWNRNYLVVKKGEICCEKLDLFQRILRYLGFYKDFKLANLLKEINELNKESLPLRFIENMKGIWEKTYPGKECPLTIPSQANQKKVEDQEKENNNKQEKENNSNKQEKENTSNKQEKENNNNKSDQNNEEILEIKNQEKSSIPQQLTEEKKSFYFDLSYDFPKNQENIITVIEAYKEALENNWEEQIDKCAVYFFKCGHSDSELLIPLLENLMKDPLLFVKFKYAIKKVLYCSLPFDLKWLGRVIDLYRLAVETNQEEIQEECNDYFQDFFSNANDKQLVDLYNLSKTNPSLFSVIEKQFYQKIPQIALNVDHLKLVIEAYASANKTKQSDNQQACESYFKNILKASTDQILYLYNLIKDNEFILACIHQEGLKELKSYNDEKKKTIKENLLKILSSLDYKEQLKLLSSYKVGLINKEFPLEIVEKITRDVFDNESNPWTKLIPFFANYDLENSFFNDTLFPAHEKIKEIVQEIFNTVENKNFLCISLMNSIKECNNNNHSYEKWLKHSWNLISAKEMEILVQKVYKEKEEPISLEFFLRISPDKDKNEEDKIIPAISSLFCLLENTSLLTFFDFLNQNTQIETKGYSSIDIENRYLKRNSEKIISSALNHLSEEKLLLITQHLLKSDDHLKLLKCVNSLTDIYKQGFILENALPSLSDIPLLKQIVKSYSFTFPLLSDKQLNDVLESIEASQEVCRVLESAAKNDMVFVKKICSYFTDDHLKKMKIFDGIHTLLKNVDSSSSYKSTRVRFCIAEALNVLESTELSKIQKIAKFVIIINALESFKGETVHKDEYNQFITGIVREGCSADHLPLVVSACESIGSNQRLGIALLTAVLKGEDLQKVKYTFQTYWTNYKKFEHSGAGCFKEILNLINSKKLLLAIIPDDLTIREEIIALVTKEYSYNDFGINLTYKLPLRKEIIIEALKHE